MIETINIWKRDLDGKYSICILDKNDHLGFFTRDKQSFASLSSALLYAQKAVDDQTPQKPEDTRWVELDSSVIKRVGYNNNVKSLFIDFKNGHKYSYQDVPRTIFIQLLFAESAGRFFNQTIKGKYNTIEV